MPTDVPYTYPGAAIHVVGQRIEFEVANDGGVTIDVEVDSDYYSQISIGRSIFISREDWNRIVAHVAIRPQEKEHSDA